VRRRTNSHHPTASLLTLNCSSVGWTATSSRSLETSIPTVDTICAIFQPFLVVRGSTLATVRVCEDNGRGPKLPQRFMALVTNGLPAVPEDRRQPILRPWHSAPNLRHKVAPSYGDGGVISFSAPLTPSPRMTGHFPI